MTGKTDICKNFSQAIVHYDEASLPQKRAAEKTYSLLCRHAGREFGRILELGCGTGHFTKLAVSGLSWDTYIANDICIEMGEIIGQIGEGKIDFVSGDAETLPFEGRFDLVCACSVIQWFDDLHEFFVRCAAKLEKGGYIAFSTFCPDNMMEIRQLTGVGLDYRPLRWYVAELENKFEILHIGEDRIRLNFDCPASVLRHIRMTGAVMNGEFSFTPNTYRKFEREYHERFSLNGRFMLTYNPLYILARLK